MEFHGDLPDFSVSIPMPWSCPTAAHSTARNSSDCWLGLKDFCIFKIDFRKLSFTKKKGTTLIEEFSNGPNMERAGTNSSYQKCLHRPQRPPRLQAQDSWCSFFTPNCEQTAKSTAQGAARREPLSTCRLRKEKKIPHC